MRHREVNLPKVTQLSPDASLKQRLKALKHW